MIRIVAESKKLKIHGPFPMDFLKQVVSKLTGRKSWAGSKYVSVEGSPWNIKIIKNSGFEVEWEDVTRDLAEIDELAAIIDREIVPIKSNYKPKYPLLDHQIEGLNIGCHRHAFAYYLEMGLGKTALTIANFCILYLERKIDAVLILAPKGVHKQWIAEEIPKHIDPSIPLNMSLWTNGK